MNELALKNNLFIYYSLIGVLFHYYFSDMHQLERNKVYSQDINQHKIRRLELTIQQRSKTSFIEYLFSDSGQLLNVKKSDFDVNANRIKHQWQSNYAYNDKMLLIKEELKDSLGSTVISNTYDWQYPFPNIMEIKRTGDYYFFDTESSTTKIPVYPANSIKLFMDSNKHVLDYLAINAYYKEHEQVWIDTVEEHYFYNRKNQLEKMILPGYYQNPNYNYFIKYNEKNQQVELLTGDIRSLDDTLDVSQITEWTHRYYDVKSRLTKILTNRNYFNKIEDVREYKYDKHGRVIKIITKGRSPFAGTRKFYYYVNGLVRKSIISEPKLKRFETIIYKYN